jgi:subtilisin family serine protease
VKIIRKVILFLLILPPLLAQEFIVCTERPCPLSEARDRLGKQGYNLMRTATFPPSPSFPQGLQFFLVTELEMRTLSVSVQDDLSITPNLPISLLATPNDPDYADKQAAFFQEISAPEGWELCHDASEIVVAIIDTGVDKEHPDLVENLWINPGEIPDNNKDDDGNGYIDDVYGWNFVDNNNEILEELPTDNAHGTHVAGIVGAVGNNNLGITGTCWKVKLMSLKIMDSQGRGTLFPAIEALAYAATNGAHLTNNSWGHEGYNYNEYLALKASHLLHICAAGNERTDNDSSQKNYPSSYDLDNIIAVAATAGRNLADYSNYGVNSVDLAAPGTGIYSTCPPSTENLDERYKSMNGTSMATPFVTGAAALIMARFPRLPAFAPWGTSIRSLLLESADPLPELVGKVAYGRLNLYRALEGQFMATSSPLRSPLGGEVFTDSVVISWQVPLSTKQVVLNYRREKEAWQELADVSGLDTYLWDTTFILGGKYQIQMVVIDADNQTAAYSSNPFTIIKRQGKIQPLPNPATDYTTFHYSLPEGAELLIYDLKGRLVYRRSLPAGEGSFLWPLKDQRGKKLAGGIYYYHLKERAGSTNGKLIVQR